MGDWMQYKDGFGGVAVSSVTPMPTNSGGFQSASNNTTTFFCDIHFDEVDV